MAVSVVSRLAPARVKVKVSGGHGGHREYPVERRFLDRPAHQHMITHGQAVVRQPHDDAVAVGADAVRLAEDRAGGRGGRTAHRDREGVLRHVGDHEVAVVVRWHGAADHHRLAVGVAVAGHADRSRGAAERNLRDSRGSAGRQDRAGDIRHPRIAAVGRVVDRAQSAGIGDRERPRQFTASGQGAKLRGGHGGRIQACSFDLAEKVGRALREIRAEHAVLVADPGVGVGGRHRARGIARRACSPSCR